PLLPPLRRLLYLAFEYSPWLTALATWALFLKLRPSAGARDLSSPDADSAAFESRPAETDIKLRHHFTWKMLPAATRVNLVEHLFRAVSHDHSCSAGAESVADLLCSLRGIR